MINVKSCQMAVPKIADKNNNYLFIKSFVNYGQYNIVNVKKLHTKYFLNGILIPSILPVIYDSYMLKGGSERLLCSEVRTRISKHFLIIYKSLIPCHLATGLMKRCYQ
jgi:hypothetical protein